MQIFNVSTRLKTSKYNIAEFKIFLFQWFTIEVLIVPQDHLEFCGLINENLFQIIISWIDCVHIRRDVRYISITGHLGANSIGTGVLTA